MATLKIPSIFTAIDKFSAPVKKMSMSMKGFGATVAASGARANRIFRRMMGPIRALQGALGGLGMMLGGAVLIQGVRSLVGVFMSFEQANADLSAVMSSATAPQLAALQKDAKRLGSTTAKTATEVVGLQEAFARLGFETPQILNMTEATINGSVAMNGGLAETAELVGAMVKTFDSFSSVDAPMILDQMTLATQTSALNFEKLQTALPIVMGAANAAGLSFTETTAILGKLSDAGVDASSSSTALRNIFIESEKQGLSYTQILEKIKNSSKKLKGAFDEFGKRGAVAGSLLSTKMDEVAAQTKKLNEEWRGTAATAAAKRLDTVTGAFTILGSAYEGFVLSLDDGKGPFSTALRSVAEIGTEMFAFYTNTQRADWMVRKSEKGTRIWAKRIMFAIKVLKWFVIGMIALKTYALLTAGAMAIYNGVIAAYNAILGFATIAQWALNAAMLANPVGLIIAGIVILIGVVALIINYWDSWGAALVMFLGPIGFVISAVQAFRKNWDMVTDAFQNGGIWEGIKAIGKVLVEAVLMPMQQLLEIMSNLPGKLGALAAEGAGKIEAFRTTLGVDVSKPPPPAVNPEKQKQEAMVDKLTVSQSNNVNILLRDQTGRAEVTSDNDLFPINLAPTWIPT